MRLPLSKVYRAFPELDRFSDQQCEGFVRSAQKAFGVQHAAIVVGLILAMVPGGCIGGGMAIFLSASLFQGDLSSTAGRMLVGLLSLSIGVSVPCLGGLLMRDFWLRRVVRTQIDRCICSKCRYSLLGLHPREGAVLCPECGTVHTLASLGVAESDLLSLSSHVNGGTGLPMIQSPLESR